LKEADDENKSIWSLTWGYSDELRESVPYDSLSKAFYPTEFNVRTHRFNLGHVIQSAILNRIEIGGPRMNSSQQKVPIAIPAYTYPPSLHLDADFVLYPQFEGKLPTPFFLTGSRSFNFITCNGAYIEITFYEYLTPFRPIAWYFILGTVPVLSLFLTVISGGVQLPRFFSLTFILASNAIDQGRAFSSKVTKAHRLIFNALFMLWLLALIVLSNGYKGIVTTDLMAPLRPASIWSDHLQLSNFTFFTRNEGYSFRSEKTSYMGQPCHFVRRYLHLQTSPFSSALVDHVEKCYQTQTCRKNERETQLQDFYSDLVTCTFPMGCKRIYMCDGGEALESFLQVSSDCDKRNVWVDYDSSIQRFHTDLESAGRGGIYMIGKPFLEKWTGFAVTGDPSSVAETSIVPKRLRSFIHSGLLHFWKVWFPKLEDSGKYWKSVKGLCRSSAIPLSINSKLISVFYIYLMGILLSLLSFSAERFFKMFQSPFRCFQQQCCVWAYSVKRRIVST
jgi:hypothetical protein